MKRFAFALAATVGVVMQAGAASADTVYDARTLGLGGSSIGYSGNPSLAYWNPAAVGMERSFGLFLPSVSFSFANNALSLGEAMGAAQVFQSLSSPSSGSSSSSSGPASSLFSNLGSNGLALQMETVVEPIGFSLGKIGPGNLAVQIYGHGLADVSAQFKEQTLSNGSATPTFMNDLSGLFLQGGFQQITTTVQQIASEANDPVSNQAQLKTDSAALEGQLKQYMSAFYKPNGTNYTTKNFTVNSLTATDATMAATYAQPVPIQIPGFPQAQLSVGATAKVLAAPSLAGISPITLQGNGNSGTLSPLGGQVGATVGLNLDKQVTDLIGAIDNFQSSQNLATAANLASATSNFFSQGLANSSVKFSNTTPDAVGAGLDLGAALKLNDQISFGLAVTNPLLFWGASQTTYAYNFSGQSIQLQNLGTTRVSFSQAEPTVFRVGGAYQPTLPGPAVLSQGLMLSAGLDVPVNAAVGDTPALGLGVEKLFGPVAVRLGTEQGGLAPLYTLGVGVQTRAFQLNLAGGVNSPSSNLQSAAVALSLGTGF